MKIVDIEIDKLVKLRLTDFLQRKVLDVEKWDIQHIFSQIVQKTVIHSFKAGIKLYLELPRARGVGGQWVLDAGHLPPAPHHGAEAEPAVRRPGAAISGHHGPGVSRLHEPDADLELEPGQGEGGGGGRGVGGRGEHNQHVRARTSHLRRKKY